MSRRQWTRVIALLFALALVAAACGDDDDDAETAATEDPTETSADEGEGEGEGEEAVGLPGNENCSSDAGVSDDSITIGVIVAQSGPVAGAGIPITAAIEAYWDRVNESGGIDGRTVEIELSDDEFKPDKTVLEFRELDPSVVAVTAFGSGGISAAAEQAQSACLVLMGNATSGGATLAGETVFTGVTPNEFEIVNLIDWWINDEGHEAPKIGVAYEGNPNGQSTLTAARYAAEVFGAEIVSEQEFANTDTSFTGQIAALQQSGADVIVVGAGNAVSYQFIAQAAQANPEWPYLGSHSIFAGDIFNLPVSAVYADRVYVGDGAIPNYADGDAAEEIGDLITERSADVPLGDVAALAAWLSQELLHDALVIASEEGDLTRGRVLDALATLERPSTFFPGETQSYGTHAVFSRAPTSGSGIFIADDDQPGDKRTVVPYFVSEASEGYRP